MSQAPILTLRKPFEDAPDLPDPLGISTTSNVPTFQTFVVAGGDQDASWTDLGAAATNAKVQKNKIPWQNPCLFLQPCCPASSLIAYQMLLACYTHPQVTSHLFRLGDSTVIQLKRNNEPCLIPDIRLPTPEDKPWVVRYSAIDPTGIACF